MKFPSDYQFHLEWDELPEDFREVKITEYIEKSEEHLPCEQCDGQRECDGERCGHCKGTGEVTPDPDDLHQREEAEEYIRAHFPIYF